MLCCTALSAQKPAWKAGLAKAVITPAEPIMMAGYADRNHPHEGVRQDIYAKALALEDETGKRFVMVTLDLVGIPRNIADPIAERAAREHGLSREQLLLNCSHTHSGPIVGMRERTSYRLTDEQEAVVKRYSEKFIETTLRVIGQALKDLAPAALSMQYGNAGFAVNRRRVTPATRDYPGPVDHDVLLIAVRGEDGKLRGVVFGYACHATVLNDYQINGDWPGYAQAAIEKDNPGAMALFLAGCGADQNPLPRRSVALAQTYGRVIADSVGQVLNARMQPLSGPLTAAFDRTELAFDTPPTREEWQRRAKDPNINVATHAQRMLANLDRDGKLISSYAYPVQVWRFGRTFTLLALAGEVVVDYSLRLRTQYGFNNLWVASYSNDVFAYIPSLRVWKEGGYEGADAMIPYGLPVRFAPSVEEVIIHKVNLMMETTAPRSR